MSKTLFFHGTTSDGFKFTTAGIAEDEQLNIGISICSEGDQFCKKTGRIRAEGRAKQHSGGSGKIELANVDYKSIKRFVATSKNICRMLKEDVTETFNMKSYGQ